MSLELDASAEDRTIFLAEADELLSLLDSSILVLERGGRDPAVVQEIFRVAHTLKGSSAAMGHCRMANLTHLMESTLDQVRQDTLEVTSELIDTLFDCLDALRVLKEEVATLEESDEDFDPLIARLQAFGSESPSAGRQDLCIENDPASERIALSAAEFDSLDHQLSQGNHAYTVKFNIDACCPLSSARCLQVVLELATLGEVVAVSPRIAEIESARELFQASVILATGESTAAIRYTLESLSDVVDVVVDTFTPEEATSGPEQKREDTSLVHQPALTTGGTKVRPGRQSSQMVRIDVERLDKLMNLVGELVIDRTRLARLSDDFGSRLGHDDLADRLDETSLHIARLTDELQQEIMKARMLPVGSVFSRFPRMMRDLAQRIGKPLDFVIEGEDTELDRSVIQEIGDPLIHLLRNSVDHGLEGPEDRRLAGKPEVGKVQLLAYHEESFIVIVVEDDGRGIDPQKVKTAALDRGLITPDRAEHMSDAESINLIFASGLTTAAMVSDISGRGVGMDIVRTNIEKLGGTVTVSSQLGKGTKFVVKLPVTLAIVPALLAGLRGGVYAIPLTSVSETLRVEPERIKRVCETDAIQLRGRVLPLLYLGSVFGHSPTNKRTGKVQVVSVRYGDHEVGLIVDSLLGQQQVVIKSLGSFLGDIKGISGATILGDGRVGLILDVPSLINVAIENGLTKELAESRLEVVA